MIGGARGVGHKLHAGTVEPHLKGYLVSNIYIFLITYEVKP